MFEHYVFDLDGTIIDSAADLAAAVNHTLAQLGLAPQPESTIVGFVGNGVRKLVERSLAAASGSPDTAQTDRALEIFLPRYADHLLDRTVAYPGVRETLLELHRRGATLSVLTNKPRVHAASILEGLALARCFAAVLGGEDLPTRKPDPLGVNRLIESSGTSRAATLMIGDSPVDVATAHAAGIDACAVTWGFSPRAELAASAPRFLVEKPQEILGLTPEKGAWSSGRPRGAS
jgi:phosphoglycolate phosphatase